MFLWKSCDSVASDTGDTFLSLYVPRDGTESNNQDNAHFYLPYRKSSESTGYIESPEHALYYLLYSEY